MAAEQTDPGGTFSDRADLHAYVLRIQDRSTAMHELHTGV